jgi:hypothetical protein
MQRVQLSAEFSADFAPVGCGSPRSNSSKLLRSLASGRRWTNRRSTKQGRAPDQHHAAGGSCGNAAGDKMPGISVLATVGSTRVGCASCSRASLTCKRKPSLAPEARVPGNRTHSDQATSVPLTRHTVRRTNRDRELPRPRVPESQNHKGYKEPKAPFGRGSARNGQAGG